MIQTRWYEGNVDIIDAHTIRAKVFINEQKVPPEVEMDDKDAYASHVVIYENENAIATGRLLIEESLFLIGRIAVIKEERKKGYGDLVVKMLVRKAFDKGAEEVNVHAQISASKFYETLGFKTFGEEYIEESTRIPHIKMVKYLDLYE